MSTSRTRHLDTIHVRTTSAPDPHAKLPADRPVSPPVPASPGETEFKLHRSLKMRAKIRRAKPSSDVAAFLGKKLKDKDKDGREAPVDVDVPAPEWAPLNRTGAGDVEKAQGKAQDREQQPAAGGSDPDGEKCVCVQRATFRSAFRLTCPPFFRVHSIECSVGVPVVIVPRQLLTPRSVASISLW